MRKVKKQRKKFAWLSGEIKGMISHKNYLLRKFRRSRNTCDQIRFQHYNKQFKEKIKKCKRSFISDKLATSNIKEKWSCINEILNRKNTKNNIEAHPVDFVTFYSELFSLSSSSNNIGNTNFLPRTALLYESDADEVANCFNHFKSKFTRQDLDLPMFLWRKISSIIIDPVLMMTNQMIEQAKFPKLLKSADITPVFKKGDKKKVENYRPIAVLHNLSKVFERIIFNRIIQFSEHENILPNQQFGFRSKHSTKDAISALFLKIEENLLDGEKSCCILLDLSKAFDSVNHDTLTRILYQLGFRGHFLKLLESYLSERTFRIRVNDFFTTTSKISRGVPQGSIISPILYSLYVHHLNSVHSDIIQYADDTTVIVRYKDLTSLQNKLNTISANLTKFLASLNLRLNTEKTEILLFKERTEIDLEFCNTKIRTKSKAKFLGVIISTDRKFDNHITFNVIPKVRQHFKIFLCLSNYLSENDKANFFRASIFPHILYSVPFISISNKKSFAALSRNYNRAIKLLFNLPLLFHSADLPQRCNVLSLSSLVERHLLTYSYLIYHQRTPAILNSYFHRTSHLNFIIKPHRDSKSIHNMLAIEWNKQAKQIRSIKSKKAFQHSLT